MASNRGSSPFGTLEHTRLESCWGKFRLLVNWEDIPIEGMVEMENNRCVLLGRVSSARSTVSVEMDMLKLAPPLSRQPLDRAALLEWLLTGVEHGSSNICFKIIGYPADFGKKKSGQNFKKQSVSNNNSVEKSSSSGFTDEQMATLISLIKDNKVGKKCAGQYGRIKVGHPNGTEAYILKIRNLILSNGLTLYNVMVIPEYCVTLISVHKLVKENKVIVAFDENKCYFLKQDLNLKNVLGIHDWYCRLGHPADPVLNVLKDTLQIDKKDNVVCCEICQRAKQTREPFPLSDHISKRFGDLVHLDLWGPYKVTSSEGFRVFLTVVDDYTRAVWVYLIKSKDGVPHFIVVFYNLIENQFKKKIKFF
ncbi:ribonuclease H-like domain-containing protein [Tanacetum coccineum]|uniref:Ribonuclease H-like domain-containing protein n=1 Tax=Tanacetum coccineum TaxID=301880 RepID=A0ABQ4XD06_9ASTR